MWNEPTKERLSKIPKLYETEDIKLQDKLIYLHFFIAGSDWYIAEFDGQDLCWGYAILNNDFDMAEWGYISFKELKEININGIEIDCELEEYFSVQKASDIEKICKGNYWKMPDKKPGQYSQEDIENLLRQAVMDDVLELDCPECGSTLRCEPDAQKSYCHDCSKVVDTNNPLIAMGLI
jgi:hypothetical protein